MSSSNQSKWYVCNTKPRWEKKIAAKLTEANIECYCPLHKVRRKWSDRYKVVLAPLFNGYIFVRVSTDKMWEVLEIPGILNYIRHQKKPAVVPENEINKIKLFLAEFENVDVSQDYNLDKDDPVTINQGIFMDYKGIVIEVIGNKARVRIESLSLSLVATFPVQHLNKSQI